MVASQGNRRVQEERGDGMNQKRCRSCQNLDYNEMTDEMYCKIKDYEQIRLRWHKQRPDWCPLLKEAEGSEE